MIEERLHLLELFDAYGSLLTEKQQECVRMHILEDFSLSEIGEALGISRQAAHDNIRRSELAMEEYEEKLGFAGYFRNERQGIEKVMALMERLDTADARLKDEIMERLGSLLKREGMDIDI